jgi:hypothetical protein
VFRSGLVPRLKVAADKRRIVKQFQA